MTRAWPVADLDPEASVLDNARRVLAVRTAEVYSYVPIITRADQIEHLHDMRISAKRLRYTLELFRREFGEKGDRAIKGVKAIQEALGTLHDHDVRIALIQDELSCLATEQAADIATAFSSSDIGDFPAIAAAALRPPPDDPKRGLIALLGREYTARRRVHEEFVALWLRLQDEGMRRDLVALSSSPIEASETAGVHLQ